jgi:AraC-like DNA-binding protein
LKEAVDETPSAFIRQHRMDRAADLLAQNPDTIAEVAYAVGFRSPSHFASVFREHYDCSPSSYVKQQEEGKNDPAA